MQADLRGHVGMIIKNKQGEIRNGYKILGFILLLFVAMSATGFLSEKAVYWGLALAALGVSWFCLKLEAEPLASIGLRINARFFAEFLSGTLLGILMILLAWLGAKFFGGVALARNPEVGLGNLSYALIPFLAVSIWEELLFRGYVFQRAIRGIGNSSALLIFALLFALVHWSNPGMEGSTKLWASLNIGLASVLLGLAWIKTKSLALPIGIHLGWNWAQGNLLGFGVSGTKPQGFWMPVFNDAPLWLTGGSFGLEASLHCTVVCIAACAGLLFWRRKATG
jgi:membrane protease YdiL (CAAX protease family)